MAGFAAIRQNSFSVNILPQKINLYTDILAAEKGKFSL